MSDHRVKDQIPEEQFNWPRLPWTLVLALAVFIAALGFLSFAFGYYYLFSKLY